MSVTILKIIPTKPDYVPQKASENNVAVYLSKIFDSNKITIYQTNNIEFVDQGQNFENIFCNHCREEIDVDIWQGAMDLVYESGFKSLSFMTPCCGNLSSLNDLLYEKPAGFAKFIITITNPEKDIQENELKEIGAILGIDQKKILARY